MDFYSIFDEQPGANEKKGETPQINNESEISVPSGVDQPESSVQSAQKSQNGAPVRWDFKAILKQEEAHTKMEVVNNSTTTEIASVADSDAATDANAATATDASIESTGDPEFDREWAEMMAKEEAEKEAQFIAQNQIATVAEIKSETVQASTTHTTTRIKSVAEIMRGFGNPGNDDDENNFVEQSEKVESIEAIVTPVTTEVESAIETPMEPVADVTPEASVEPVAEITPGAEVGSEIVTEFVSEEEVNVSFEFEPEASVEVSDEIISEIVSEPVSEIVAEPIAETTIEPNAEFTPEVIAEVEETWSEEFVDVTATDTDIDADAYTDTNAYADTDTDTDTANWPTAQLPTDFMIESTNTFSNEEFEPIELASEPELPAEPVIPVFVNVEHAWMFAEEVQQEPAEMITESSFENSLPGELPLFGAGSQEGINMQTDTHTHNNLKSEEAMKFELPEYSSIIKVIGVGGGGSNAVNHMYKLGIKGVDFLVCNTDKQALDLSPVPHKIVLGTTLTEGRGAGSIPEVGRNAAIENLEDLRAVLSNNTKMVFITAGMGGGTGTGAAPVIAGVARELGILTVGIVTVPFAHEGKKRRQYAEEGIEMLKQNVDTLLVIRNDKLREMYGNLKLSDAFAHADDVLTTAAKSIAEIISITQQINVDFADICTVMRNSGVAIMGSAIASGENRAVRAVEMSLNSPLLNDNNIIGARYVLLNIISGADEITMDELGEITDFIQEAAGQTAEIIKGYGVDPSLGDSVSVTIIATGFQQTNPVNYEYTPKSQPEKVVRQLEEKTVFEAPKAETTSPVAETELNPLEPFLVSKPVEPVVEAKAEWTAQNTVEFEIVNTSQEITETTNEITVSNEEVTSDFTSETEISSEEIAEPVLIVKEEPKAEIDPVEAAKKAEQEEIQRRANERIQKLRDISLKLKSPQVLNEMENEPAYKRRNVNLENVPHSSESQVSRFTLTETDEKKIEIRPNNSFLHDNVD